MISGYSFTEAVRIVLAGAREKALELGHHRVQIEHLLLTPIERGDPMTMAIWQQLAVDPVALAQSIRSSNPPDPPSSTVSDLPYSAKAKRALEVAMQQARDLADNYVGPEHLLLGAVAESTGRTAGSLAERGVTVESARVAILAVRGRPTSATTHEGAPAQIVSVAVWIIRANGLTERRMFDDVGGAAEFLRSQGE